MNGITRITVSGYKSLWEESSIELRPLTILAGANGSGKSSIMQPLLLLKQTLEAQYDPGPLLLDGPHVHFTEVDQFLSRVASESVSEASCEVELDGDTAIKSVFRRASRKGGLDLVQMDVKEGGRQFSLFPDMAHDEILSSPLRELLNFFRVPPPKSEDGRLAYSWGTTRDRCFLSIVLYQNLTDGAVLELPVFSPFTTPIKEDIRRVIHVPALRGIPARTYMSTTIGPAFPGTFEHYVASVINHWQVANSPNLKELGDTLENLGLTWKVGAERVDDVHIGLKVGRLLHSTRGGARDMVNIADAGFGLSQVLPVLAALLIAEPGQTVYLEQPEIHLHPRAEAAMAEVLADAAKRGVNVVVETHSSLLLRSIQALVAEHKLPHEAVKLHWFTRIDKGVTRIDSTDLDETGAFGDWPEDFAETELQVESRYLDAALTSRQNPETA